MKRERRIKIIATLGPASSTPEMCAKLFAAGVDVFRINMSHTQRETLPEKVAMLRALEGQFRRPVVVDDQLHREQEAVELRVQPHEGVARRV